MSDDHIRVVHKDGEGKEISVAIDNSLPLLDNLEEAGVDQPSSCMSGACGTCVTKVEEGMEHLEKEKFGDALFPVEDGEILTCVCGIKEESFGKSDASVILAEVD
jgi:ferredoxin